MIEAIVFDMDGLIVDSQPFWQTAQLEVFLQLGVAITRSDTINTTGMRVDQIVQACYTTSPWDSVSCNEVCNRIVNRVIELVRERKPAMLGLNHAIETCRQQGLKMALASSSPLSLIQATVEALQLDGIFHATLSAEELRYGKPHPEIYLNACDTLGTEPGKCVAIEDSFIGLIAAKAAQMKTIVIPEHSLANQNQFVIADKQLTSLEEVTSELLQSL